ncbi:hypothetical protein SNE40_002371 [Patella caerulea]
MYKITLLFMVATYACLGLVEGYRPSYRAAVYEHALFQPTHFRTVSRSQALRDMKKNLDIYAEQTRIASSQNVDIIVFPEDGIYGLNFNRDTIKPYLEDIPDPTEITWNPCNQSEYTNGVEVQITLSCMARNNGIYIVANMGDKKVCDADSICPDDGQRQYNTDVVFDPQGNLVARYHKQHLYFEAQFDTPSTVERVTFDTPFGKFGIITCFDILFKSPAVDLVEDLGVKNVIFPTAWMDSLPLLSAIQFHSAFAKLFKVNLLAANLHFPLFNFHGSGIYSPRRTEAYYYNDGLFSPGKLLIADVKSSPTHYRRHQVVPDTHGFRGGNSLGASFVHGQDTAEVNTQSRRNGGHYNTASRNGIISHQLADQASGVHLNNDLGPLTHRSIRNRIHNHAHLHRVNRHMVENGWATIMADNDNYQYLPLTEPKAKVKICQNEVCCYLDYQKQNTSNDELYALGVFDGLHQIEGLSWYTQVCVLLKCEFTDIASCGQPTKIAAGHFEYLKLWGTFTTEYVFPEVLVSDDGKLRLEHEHWKYLHNRIEFVNRGKESPLLSATLYGRHYDRDNSTVSNSV